MYVARIVRAMIMVKDGLVQLKACVTAKVVIYIYIYTEYAMARVTNHAANSAALLRLD
jgi:hypothetical protein